MRTALIAWDYPPSPSGLSTAAREIAESLAEAGTRVTVFTLDRAGRERQGALEVVGVPLPRGSALGRIRLFGGVGHLAAPLAFRSAVLAEHRREPFAVVEATNWYAPAALLAGGGALPPLVSRLSTPAAFSRGPVRSLRDRVDNAFADRLERRQVRGSAAIISNTVHHGNSMTALYGIGDDQPLAVIGLSLAPAFLAGARRSAYPEPDPVEGATILFVGRAEHRKGFDALLGAVEILAEECERGRLPPFRLRLLGVPAEDLPASLSDRERRHVAALGRRGEEALLAEYARAHIVAAPSRYESFGLVYQEALAMGRPMVASAEDPSARELVTGGGSLAAATTAEALADALRPLVASAERRFEARERALRAAGRFTRRSLGDETLALYGRAIRHARRQGR